MATRVQRKQEKRKQKRRKKKLQQSKRVDKRPRTSREAAQSNARHRQRLARQKPEAWEGEPAEDVAVFDDAVFGSLSPEVAGQVSAIREALQFASESRGDDALKRTSEISRSSPLSEWRLFIRGLVAWMAHDIDAADAVWQRLNPERRPGRIAIAMMSALLSDLDRVSVEHAESEASHASQADWCHRLDGQLLYHAKLLRRVRFDRAAVRIAEAGVRVPEESKSLQLGPRRIKWLKNFADEYRETEPGLVASLERVALGRAFVQEYSDLFDTAIEAFTGPRHDPRNRLLTFFYYSRFDDDPAAEQRAERILDEYLTKDLPQNKELSESLRNAISSQIHLNEAVMLIQPAGGGMMPFLFAEQEDAKAIRKHLQTAVRDCPVNRRAYKVHVEWIESKREDERLTKPRRKTLTDQLVRVMQDWARGLPDDVEPRLWLVDHLLENEQTEDAEPHVHQLAATRQDDPRVRATPWKWQLLEAMRLCRRKAWLSDVPARLEEAESQWPTWLSSQWLPYLKAAWTLRCGKTDEFEQQRQAINRESGVARDSLADACMMLGAAQRMRVAAADLKPLRAPVDAAVKGISRLKVDELLSVGGFFWDLQRTQLLYPAYRMHGGKLGKELWARFADNPRRVLDHLDDEAVHAAVLWCSEHRFWCNSYELNLPRWYSRPAVQQHPLFAAARVNAYLKTHNPWSTQDYRDIGPMLREAAPSQRDPFYRHWFVSLADELDEKLASASSRPFGFGFSALARMFEADDEDDECDDFLDFDPDCNCPECRAAKRAYEASR